MTKTRLPTLPPPTDPTFSDRLAEILQVFMGNRGDSLDKVVTFRDLENKQVAEKLVSTGANGLRLGASGATAGSVGGTSLPTLAVPPAVVGATIGGAFSRMVLSWTPPKYANHAYTEVRRSTTNSIASAVQIGSTVASTYVDVVGGGFTGYYWLRHVTTDGGVGPWSPALTATTPASHEEVLNTLTSAEWQASTSYSIFTPVAPTTEVAVGGALIRLVAVSTGVSGATEPDWATAITVLGDTVVDGTVTWQAVEVGKIPFFIDPATGLVVIDGASIRSASVGSLQVRDGFFDTMTAAKGTLGEANISMLNVFDALVNNYIRSDSYSPGVSGWTINKDGTAEFQDVIARGDVEASSLKAATAMVYSANIADLQVDTIHIQDQAVTFPVAYENDVDEFVQCFASGVFDTGWNDFLSATIYCTGANVAVNCSYETTRSANEPASGSNTHTFYLRLYNETTGQVIFQDSKAYSIDAGDGDLFEQIDRSLHTLHTPAAGNNTIKLQYRCARTSTDGINAHAIYYSGLLWIEAKK